MKFFWNFRILNERHHLRYGKNITNYCFSAHSFLATEKSLENIEFPQKFWMFLNYIWQVASLQHILTSLGLRRRNWHSECNNAEVFRLLAEPMYVAPSNEKKFGRRLFWLWNHVFTYCLGSETNGSNPWKKASIHL